MEIMARDSSRPAARLGRPLFALLLALAGCARHDPALERYAKETLRSGIGLGDLRIDATTLASAVQRFGAGSVTQLASEEVGLELFYEHGQLALLFVIDPACLDSLPGRSLRPAAVDLAKFLEQNPCLRETRLTSLSVRAGKSPSDSFFQGATDAGAKLWDTRAQVLAHGTPGGGSGHLLAGENPNNPREQLHFASGICFYLQPGEDGDPARARVQRITLSRPVE
jgi:hypothetical protein